MNKAIKETYLKMNWLKRNIQYCYLNNYFNQNVKSLTLDEKREIADQMNYLKALNNSERFLKEQPND